VSEFGKKNQAVPRLLACPPPPCPPPPGFTPGWPFQCRGNSLAFFE
jgi:hypothetical protein